MSVIANNNYAKVNEEIIMSKLLRKDILDRKMEIFQWVNEKRSKNWMCKQLSCKSSTLNNYLKLLNIEYVGQRFCKNYNNTSYIPSEIYTSELSNKSISSHRLKNKLIRDGVKEDRCEICGITEWIGKKLTLQLHHKDGNHYNNRLDNLQILCPNCHSLQETNCIKNLKCIQERVSNHKKNYVRYNSKTLPMSVWEERLNLILTCGVDLTKYGWKTKVINITKLTKRQIEDVVLKFKNYFKDSKFTKRSQV